MREPDTVERQEPVIEAPAEEVVAPPAHPDLVAKCRWCPICWNTLRGVGDANGTKKTRVRHYRCNQCRHSWKYVIPSQDVPGPEHG